MILFLKILIVLSSPRPNRRPGTPSNYVAEVSARALDFGLPAGPSDLSTTTSSILVPQVWVFDSDFLDLSGGIIFPLIKQDLVSELTHGGYEFFLST